ncbi:MAG: pilus assembly protein PilM [Phycisphaerae bacterium]|jgi:type IV pilus assembly protein PilM
MTRLWAKNKRQPIALDIGADSIKMLQLDSTKQGPRVAAWGYKPLAKTADPAQWRQQVVAGVAELRRQGGFEGRKVVTALSCSELAIKSLRMPAMPEAEMRNALKWEAQERLGFEVADDQFNFLSAGEVRSGNDTCQEIILLAVEGKTIEAHTALLAEMKLTPVFIEAAPIVVYRVLGRSLPRKSDDPGISVVVDVGYSGTRVVVGRGEQVVFIKSIELGGRHMVEAVSKQLGLGFDEACQLRQRMIRQRSDAMIKGQAGVDGNLDWTMHDAIRAEVESLASEIALCLRYCSVTFRGLRPSQIVLCGGEAYDPSISKILGEHLDVECVLGQPLQGVDTTALQSEAHERGCFPEWALCAGMSLRAIRNPSEAQHAEHKLSA